MRLLLAAAALLAFIPPACAGTVGISMDINMAAPDRLVETAVAQLTGSEAGQIRQMADTDQDGMITQAEQDALVAQLDGQTSTPTADDATIDGIKASTAVTVTTSLDGLVGSASATGPITIHAMHTLSYIVPAANQHIVRSSKSSGQSSASGTAPFTFHAPAGFTVSATTGLPAGTVTSADKMTVTWTDSMYQDHEESITVTKATAAVAPGKSSPAIGPELAIGLLALAGFVARRRLD
ncbi:MAG: hypothetical protein V4510_12600 [bacterium]